VLFMPSSPSMSVGRAQCIAPGLAFLACLPPIEPSHPVAQPAASRIRQQTGLVGIAAGPPPQAAPSPDDSA
jgi:hypothetical protein